jgi:hypothetical protein
VCGYKTEETLMCRIGKNYSRDENFFGLNFILVKKLQSCQNFNPVPKESQKISERPKSFPNFFANILPLSQL